MATSRVCEGCQKDTESKLKCPKCVQLGLPGAYFCNQDCFKKAWSTHAERHKGKNPDTAPTQLQLTYGQASLKLFKPTDKATWARDFHLRRFLDYTFTGSLRPWPQTSMNEIPADKTDSIPTPDYASDPAGRSKEEERASGTRIVCHKPETIARIRAACLLGRRALDLAHGMCRPGVTPHEIDTAVHQFIVDNGGYPSPLGYYGFPKSLCTSVNEVICHGIPDLRPLENGDIINVDVTVYLNGAHGDLNETFCVGECDEGSKKLIKAAHDACLAAIKICKPGTMYKDVGKAISDVVEPAGFSVVKTYCGHGIGPLFHTAPNVFHQRNSHAKGVMMAGHVFTIEPMINAGSYKDKLWPDQWTAVTEDGKRSAQFEHQLLITEDGVEILTARLPESPPLWWEINEKTDKASSETSSERSSVEKKSIAS